MARRKGSWDLARVVNKVTILLNTDYNLTAPIKVLKTLLTKSHDPPSMAWEAQSLRSRFVTPVA